MHNKHYCVGDTHPIDPRREREGEKGRHTILH